MPYKDYRILSELKPGGTSRVYRVQDVETDELRVMKVTSFQQIQKPVWLNEIQMLQKFQYVRGVVKMYEFGEVADSNQETFGYTVLELCQDDLFESPIRDTERKAVFLFLYGILTTLHALGFCYCDLKPENILRQGKGFRLCDFSSCQPIGTLTNVMYGTPHVMAPEILQTLEAKKDYFYDEKIDSWGLGCLLFELLTRKQFDRAQLTQQVQSVSDPYFRTILQLCLEVNPVARVRVWELSKKMKDLPGAEHSKPLVGAPLSAPVVGTVAPSTTAVPLQGIAAPSTTAVPLQVSAPPPVHVRVAEARKRWQHPADPHLASPALVDGPLGWGHGGRMSLRLKRIQKVVAQRGRPR